MFFQLSQLFLLFVTMFRFLVLFNCCKSAKILVSTRELSIRNICCCFSRVKANFMSGLLAQISLQIFVLLRDCCVFFFLHPRQLIVIVIIMKCSAQFALSRNIQKHRTWRKNNIFILSWYVRQEFSELNLHKLLLLTCDCERFFCERHLKKFSEWFHYHVEANWRSGKFSTCALVSRVYSKKYCRLRWADDSFSFVCISSAIKHAHTISCETWHCRCHRHGTQFNGGIMKRW